MSQDTATEIVEPNDAAVGTNTDGTTEEGQFETTETRPSVPGDPPRQNTADRCIVQLESLLQEPIDFPAEPQDSPRTIFKIPQLLRGIDPKAEEPEIVSIGPYHRGRQQVREFEKLKPLFLKKFLRRCKRPDLREVTKSAASWEPFLRSCYSERVDLTSHDFLQMMLLDGCFVVEFLLHPLFESGNAADEPSGVAKEPGGAANEPGGAPDVPNPMSESTELNEIIVNSRPGPIVESGDVTNEPVTNEPDPILDQPQMIPTLIRDLLKLENQIPYKVLDFLFEAVDSSNLNTETYSLTALALKLFNHGYPRPMRTMQVLKSQRDLDPKHLLDLFYMSLSPTRPVDPNSPKESWSSAQSVPRVTELRHSGVKFKSKKADSLLDINFHKPMLWNPLIPIKDFKTSSLMNPVIQMPNIAINDFMTTMLINCMSLEQCLENRSKYMTDYVSFMHCLINQPKDMSLLRSDGIITLYSRDDQYVADLFNKLGKNISFNVHDCFLSKQFEELESYYHSNWAKMMRTYFSSPWSAISLFSAFLIVVLSITQTITAILAYRSHR